MAYYTGQCTSYQNLADILVEKCQAHGWAWQNLILSHVQFNLHLEIKTNQHSLMFRGIAHGVYTPNACRIGRVSSSMPNADVQFPCGYDLFIFESEVYLVINYNYDYYQWLAFGKSDYDFSHSAGTGMWISASLGEAIVSSHNPIAIGTDYEGGSGNQQLVSPAPFWGSEGVYTSYWRQSFLHSNLDQHGWVVESEYFNKKQTYQLFWERQPNAWNADAILLPITVYKGRPQNKISLILQTRHSRFLRIDNHEPKDIIQLGHEKWKVFPFFKKNMQQRNGGFSLRHTGTFGWAIRYEG